MDEDTQMIVGFQEKPSKWQHEGCVNPGSPKEFLQGCAQQHQAQAVCAQHHAMESTFNSRQKGTFSMSLSL